MSRQPPLIIIAVRSADSHAPPAVYWIVLPFGVLSALGGIMFMAGIRSWNWQLRRPTFQLTGIRGVVPGTHCFPATPGGNPFVVAAAGLLLFREKLGPYCIAGILAGIASLVLLSLG